MYFDMYFDRNNNGNKDGKILGILSIVYWTKNSPALLYFRKVEYKYEFYFKKKFTLLCGS